MTPVHLNDHHRDTIKKIFSHSSSGNIEWRQVLSLLSAVGTTTEEDNGKVRVTLGPETEVLRPPHGKDIDEQTLVDLRRMLRQQDSGRRAIRRPLISARATTAMGSGASPPRPWVVEPAEKSS